MWHIFWGAAPLQLPQPINIILNFICIWRKKMITKSEKFRQDWIGLNFQGNAFSVNTVHIHKRITYITKCTTSEGSLGCRRYKLYVLILSFWAVFSSTFSFVEIQFHLNNRFTWITVSSRQEGSWGLTGETGGRLPACAQWRQPLQPWHWPPI